MQKRSMLQLSLAASCLIPAVLSILLVLPATAFSQRMDQLPEGSRVKIGLRIEVTPVSGKSRTGNLMLLRNDSLFYSPSGAGARWIFAKPRVVQLAYSDVKAVRVSRGRNVMLSILTKGLIGTAIGAGVGAGYGAATWKRNSGDYFAHSRNDAASSFGFIGGLFGLVSGAIYGAENGYDRWETIALPVSSSR